ncbi:MAG: DUF4404 family protein [bacterium]
MENQKLRKMLEQLHSELKETETVDKSGSELLHILMNDIKNILDKSAEEQSRQRSSLINQLKQAILYFEESHPTLALSMKKVIDTLSNMGI